MSKSRQNYPLDSWIPYRSIAILLLGLAWSILVLVGYYFVHKPLVADQVVAVVRTIGISFSALALTGLAGGLGYRLLKIQSLNPLERFGLQAALGWALLGIAWLLVGLLGGYSRMLAWGGLVLGWFILWREILSWGSLLKGFVQLWAEASCFGKTLAALAGCTISGQFMFALAPPVQWDALMYHLELPRRYLAAGRFEFVSWNPYWGQPQLGELLYTWGMGLFAAETAAVIGWTIQFALLAGLVGLVARRVGTNSAWVAISALLAGNTFRWMMSGAYVDGLAALYGLAALVSLLAWLDERQQAWLWLMGVFAGCALWSKLTAGLMVPLLAIAILGIDGWKSWANWRRALQVMILALLIYLPWLAIVTAWTGSPVFPHLWPTTYTSLERLAFFARGEELLGGQAAWLPLAATWFGVDGARVSGMVTYGADLGPLLVLLAVPGVIIGRKVRMIRLVMLWMLAGWLAMVVFGGLSPLLFQTRLYFVLTPAAVLAVGWGWKELSAVQTIGIRLGRVLAVLVILVVGLCAWQDALALVRFNPAGVLTGVYPKQAYLEARLGGYAAAMRAVQSLPPEARTLFLWEPRGLYAPLSAQPDAWIDRWFLERRTSRSAPAILDSWRSQGFTHLLVYRSGAEFERQERGEYRAIDWQEFDRLIAELPSLLDLDGVYQLYSLSP
ncbi:MAG: hypothetical protein A2Z45_00690 [Chloroflexi bacterium RBG_19FT_COMBO_55_16]|nr:MAG: hypothetical protein A2Z45_00690 [Chloroflexi bacterium RBG_19FT_COMBO_55_16]